LQVAQENSGILLRTRKKKLKNIAASKIHEWQWHFGNTRTVNSKD